MSISFSKQLIPIFVKPIVPAWVLIAAMVVQYAFTETGKPDEPDCIINVQQVHTSTYSQEFTKLTEAKLKISTSCNSPQSFTSLNATIEEVRPGRPNRVVKTFSGVVGRPGATNQNFVLIENLTSLCLSKKSFPYVGRANGQVQLRNGGIVKISGISNEPRLLNCQIGAK